MELRKLLDDAKISQQQLADALNIPRNTVWRWVNGRATPSGEMLQRIAPLLNVSIDELLNGPEAKEFEVKIVMGVKNLTGLAGMEVADNSFIYGVQDDKPQIHLAGKIMIGTPEEREDAKALLLAKFDRACWMFDHRDDEKA